jgi:hypothetical protein
MNNPPLRRNKFEIQVHIGFRRHDTEESQKAEQREREGVRAL